MSSALTDVWSSGLDPSKCKTSTLVDYLDERGVLAYGYTSDETLTPRDDDRVQILKHVANHPEGILQAGIVANVCKGIKLDSNLRSAHVDRFDGSDADYQFVRRFVQDAAHPDDDETAPLLRTRRVEAGRLVMPTPEMLDLISEGITETTTNDDSLIYDRDFVRNILGTVDRLDDGHRDLIASSLQRYINRVNDYRLVFDVTASDGFRGSGSRTMTKGYKTRFNDDGRIRKMFARYNQALEQAYNDASNAVLVTLTSDPGSATDPTRPDPRSILELIDNINENFHRLTQYLKSDPSTKGDTRDPGVAAYRPELADDVTGRPRKKLDYLKALEFTERGLPHLHVLFFDVPPKRGGDLDGCPWLIDKQELSDKWSDYGQGQIVDVYPLTYRDDLDDLDGDTEFATDEGFVCWYRYGENQLDDDRVHQLSRSHQIDMIGDDDNPMQKTAGQYLGKYLSMTFAALLDASGEDLDDRDGYEEKFAAWKLGMYWATGKQFWSISRRLERKIDRDDRLDDDPARAVRWASKLDTQIACERLGVAEFVPDDVQGDRHRSTVSRAVSGPFVNIDYLGAFHFADIPGYIDTSARSSIEPIEKEDADPEGSISIDRGDRPPPIADVWN